MVREEYRAIVTTVTSARARTTSLLAFIVILLLFFRMGFYVLFRVAFRSEGMR